MSAVVNARDIALQATDPRLVEVDLGENVLIPALKGLKIASPSLTFPVDGDGVPSFDTILLTVVSTQITGTVAWEVTSGTAVLTNPVDPIDIDTNLNQVLSFDTMMTSSVTIKASVVVGAVTYSQEITISKVIDGTNPKTLTLNLSALVFKRTSDNAIYPPSDVITLTAVKNNTVEVVNWVTVPSVTLYTAPTGGTVATSGDVLYLRASGFGTNQSVKITASVIVDPLTLETLEDAATVISVRDGAAGARVAVSNPLHPLPTTALGVVTYTGSGTSLNVYEGAVACTITAATASGGGTITPGTASGAGTATVTFSDHSSVTGSVAKVTYTLTYTKPDGTSATITSFQSLSKSVDGNVGSSVDIVFKRSASQPATPGASSGTPTGWYTDVASVPVTSDPMYSAVGTKAVGASTFTWEVPIKIEGSTGASGLSIVELTVYTRGTPTSTPTGGSYNFGTKVLTAPTGTGVTWTSSVPAGSTPLYVSKATASIQGTTGSATPGTWTAPVISSQDGGVGAPGDAIDIVFVRSASQPATPAASAGAPAGWYTDVASVPASENLMWSSVGTKVSGATTYTWDTPIKIEGSAGSSGLSIAELTVYTRGTPTSTPTGGSYNFGTKVLTAPTGTGVTWTSSVTAGSTPLYVSKATASIQGTTGSATPGTWTAPVISSQDGGVGSPGSRQAVLGLYQWGWSSPTAPTGTSTETWSTGIHTYGGADGWTVAIPVDASPGKQLYYVEKPITDATGAADTSTATWSGVAVRNISANAGNSYRCYSRATGIVTPTAASTASTAVGSYPLVTSFGLTWNAAFTATAPTLSAGETLWISDGYTNNSTGQITWTTPYLSTFKVGSLSALSADLGTITAGTVTGALLRTAASGKRIEIDYSTNSIKIYASGTGTVVDMNIGGSSTAAMTGTAAANFPCLWLNTGTQGPTAPAARFTGNATGGGVGCLVESAGTGEALNVGSSGAAPAIIAAASSTSTSAHGITAMSKNGYALKATPFNTTNTLATVFVESYSAADGIYCNNSSTGYAINCSNASSGDAIRATATSGKGLNASATIGFGVCGSVTTGTGVAGSASTTGKGVSGDSSSGVGVYGTSISGVAVHGYASHQTNSGNHGVRGQHVNGGAAIIGTANGFDVYCEGTGTNIGPFTGAHEALVMLGFEAAIGDIMIDVEEIAAGGISNTLFLTEPSTLPMQKGSIGIFAHKRGILADEYMPAVFNPGSFESMQKYYEVRDNYEVINVNALGEGQMNVCGEGGDLEVGDLIVTSSIRGKGMRQSDDLIRSYTVARCRKSVKFSGPTDVRLVACIYLCG
jgi:hypothetical protein